MNRLRMIGPISLGLLAVLAGSPAHAHQSPRDRAPGGRVILYDAANFRGSALVLYPGDRVEDFEHQPYDDGNPSNDRVSSIRIEGNVELILHSDSHLQGEALRLRDSVTNLADVPGPNRRGNWNDFASSAAVIVAHGPREAPPPGSGWNGGPGARVELYGDSNYRGSRLVLAAGDRIINLADARFEDGAPINDRISSIRVVGGATVTVYEAADFRGAALLVDESVPNFAFRYDRPNGESWNDVISSLTVARGHASRSAEQVVLHAYRELLGREPEPAALARYADALRHRGFTEQELRTELRRTREYREREAEQVIHRVYQQLLKRAPDAGGLAHYKTMMVEQAWSERDVREAIRRSDEYRQATK